MQSTGNTGTDHHKRPHHCAIVGGADVVVHKLVLHPLQAGACKRRRNALRWVEPIQGSNAPHTLCYPPHHVRVLNCHPKTHHRHGCPTCSSSARATASRCLLINVSAGLWYTDARLPI